jgi:hypothetical protein
MMTNCLVVIPAWIDCLLVYIAGISQHPDVAYGSSKICDFSSCTYVKKREMGIIALKR